MKTVEDFKGSDILQVREIKQDDVFEIVQPDIDRTIAVINYWDGKRQKAAANARLFANSKKVLEAAIELVAHLNEFSLGRHEKELVGKLEQAINDSL